MGNRRPTDCKGNLRTYLPEARPIREEAEMVLREEAWKEEVDKFTREDCREDGTQIYNNLSKKEKVGMKSLIKRRNAGEIVITVGDKYKRLSVSSMASYREQGLVHTKSSIKCGWNEIRPRQRRVTAVSRSFSNVVQIGSNGSEIVLKECLITTVRMHVFYQS